MPTRGAVFGPLQPSTEKRETRGFQIEFDGPKSSAVNPLIPSDGDRASGVRMGPLQRPQETPSLGRSVQSCVRPCCCLKWPERPLPTATAVNQRIKHYRKMLLESAGGFVWGEGLGEEEKAEVDRAQSVGFDLWEARFSNPGNLAPRGASRSITNSINNDAARTIETSSTISIILPGRRCTGLPALAVSI